MKSMLLLPSCKECKMIKLYNSDGTFLLVEKSRIAHIDQAMGDVNNVYDYCGSILTGFICKDCLNTGNSAGCARLKISHTVISVADSPTVTFIDGSISICEGWEAAEDVK